MVESGQHRMKAVMSFANWKADVWGRAVVSTTRRAFMRNQLMWHLDDALLRKQRPERRLRTL